MRYVIYGLICISLCSGIHALSAAPQTPWTYPTVQGFRIYQGKEDYTSGLGAFMDMDLRPNTKNFDNGGGAWEFNTTFLRRHYGVENHVYDPYNRTPEHNNTVIVLVDQHLFDTTTSCSVLNLIDLEDARYEHIFLSCKALKEHGVAYFKVYPGDGSGQEEYFEDSKGFQANKYASAFQKEVEAIFGEGNVLTDVKHDMIIAHKNCGCSLRE